MDKFSLFIQKFLKGNSRGYSTIELLLASAVGSIVIAGAYSSYSIMGRQQARISSITEIQEAGLPTLNLISRDLRMAGRVAYDSSVDPVYGAIATPVSITDSGNACCDSIVLIYDKSSTERRRVTYFTDTRTNPTREAIYMDVDLWNGTSWVSSINDSLVTDYVEDLQFEGSDDDGAGNPRIVDMSMVLRGKTQTTKTITYAKPAQVAGNYNYSFSDGYYRDTFMATVNIKNMR